MVGQPQIANVQAVAAPLTSSYTYGATSTMAPTTYAAAPMTTMAPTTYAAAPMTTMASATYGTAPLTASYAMTTPATYASGYSGYPAGYRR